MTAPTLKMRMMIMVVMIVMMVMVIRVMVIRMMVVMSPSYSLLCAMHYSTQHTFTHFILKASVRQITSRQGTEAQASSS